MAHKTMNNTMLHSHNEITEKKNKKILDIRRNHLFRLKDREKDANW